MNAFARELPRPMCAADVCARLESATLVGNPDRPVRAIGALSSQAAGILAFCDAAPADDRLARSRASVVVVPRALEASPEPERTLIAVDDVRAAFIDLVESLLPGSARPADPAPGMDRQAKIDERARVSPLACIGADVRIGARTRVAPGAVVYDDR